MHPIIAKRLVFIGSPPDRVKKGYTTYLKKKALSDNISNTKSQYTSSTAYPLVITFLVIYQPCFEITFKTVECVLGKCTGCECVCVCVCVGGWCCVKLVCKQK